MTNLNGLHRDLPFLRSLPRVPMRTIHYRLNPEEAVLSTTPSRCLSCKVDFAYVGPRTPTGVSLWDLWIAGTLDPGRSTAAGLIRGGRDRVFDNLRTDAGHCSVSRVVFCIIWPGHESWTGKTTHPIDVRGMTRADFALFVADAYIQHFRVLNDQAGTNLKLEDFYLVSVSHTAGDVWQANIATTLVQTDLGNRIIYVEGDLNVQINH